MISRPSAGPGCRCRHRRRHRPAGREAAGQTPTFRAAALATLEANRPRWRSARTARAWIQSLEKHAFPEIGTLRVDTIAQADGPRTSRPAR